VNVVKGPLRGGAHAAAPAGTYALVGGTTAVFADIQRAVNHDYALVFPVAAVIILLILALVLRSAVAPWYLMASVGLGFGAALGASVLVFQGLRGQAGLVFLLPVYIYVFVVALGTDYNILMISRLREEASAGQDPHDAAALALRHAGPTIGAADVILAGTFASLTLAGNSILSQLGFAVSCGIALAAFVMAMFFTPSLTALIGRRAWWPRRADQPGERATKEAWCPPGCWPQVSARECARRWSTSPRPARRRWTPERWNCAESSGTCMTGRRPGWSPWR